MNATNPALFGLALLCAAISFGCSANDAPPLSSNPNGAGSGALIQDVATPCVPQCANKACGFDGCFGECGTCSAETQCVEGQCTAYTCQPSCEGRACGDDGCGGSCGSCSEGRFCLTQTGTCQVADPCGGVSATGCCDGDTLRWCVVESLQSLSCEGGCGWDEEIGEYNCGGEGADPSGTHPMMCGAECSCVGKNCGDDGCGGSCGSCEGGAACVAGICTTDECGGITYDGCCQGETAVWCDGGELLETDCSDEPSCGWIAGTGYYCGSNGGTDPDGLPKECPATGDPPPECTPSCVGKVCGDDGCGGTCGSCTEGQSCEGGACVQSSDGCGGITYDGCCDGEVATYCVDDELVSEDCAGDPVCGWIPGTGYYCGSEGGSDPDGLPKACPGSAPDPCATLGEEGCCDGNTLRWCEGSTYESQVCGSKVCGWNTTKGEYGCGTEDGSDPSNTYPKACQ